MATQIEAPRTRVSLGEGIVSVRADDVERVLRLHDDHSTAAPLEALEDGLLSSPQRPAAERPVSQVQGSERLTSRPIAPPTGEISMSNITSEGPVYFREKGSGSWKPRRP